MMFFVYCMISIQLDDVIDIVYKLRHTSNAADLLPSTEYALIRMILKYDPQRVFMLADDPVSFLFDTEIYRNLV